MVKRTPPTIGFLLFVFSFCSFGQSPPKPHSDLAILFSSAPTQQSIDFETLIPISPFCLECENEVEFFSVEIFVDSLTRYSSLERISTAASPEVYSSSNDGAGFAALGALGLTALMIHTDQQTYDALHGWKQRESIVQDVSPKITYMGDGAFSMGLFGGFIAYSVIFNDKKSYEVGKIGVESFALSGIAVQFLKHLFGRERPSAATQSGGTFHGPFSYFHHGHEDGLGLSHFDAFPSGHTATAFAAATTISDLYSNHAWVSYVSYSLASGVAVSRITERTHWVSDCFVGALIGIYSTKLIEKLNSRSSEISLSPTAGEHQYGVTLSMKL